jgi:arsenate reductase
VSVPAGRGERAPPAIVLFACVHNAGRSQMAAAFFDAEADAARAQAASAGTQPAAAVHPAVVQAMREAGLDLSGAVPRRLTDELARGARLLVTMGCGEECPAVPGLARRDWPLRDPHGEGLDAVRTIRDEIRARVSALLHERGWRRVRGGAPAALRPAEASDLPAVRALLAEAGLPTDDLSASSLAGFVVAARDGRTIGAAGLEWHGDAALLRSVVVSGAERGAGLGAELVADRLACARRAQVAAVHLLTQDASAFFSRFGFVAEAREAAPAAIGRSSQFSGGGCASATAMVLSLSRAAV